MTTVLVTGAGGQLGQELQQLNWTDHTRLVPLTSSQLDITAPESVSATVAEINPDVIVNAAAYTAVDRAEEEPDRAMAVNATAVSYLAEAANRHTSLLIHISTDYVFDGLKGEPYVEQDPISPTGVYGHTKAAGEAAAALADRSLVLRSSWLYSSRGNNFVSTMLRLASERDQIGVVDDQFGCPTAVPKLAAALQQIIYSTGAGTNLPAQRIYHAACTGTATWYDLAEAAFSASAVGFSGQLSRLATSEYPTKATRPPDSRLNCCGLERDLGISLGPWQAPLAQVVKEITNKHSESHSHD